MRPVADQRPLMSLRFAQGGLLSPPVESQNERLARHGTQQDRSQDETLMRAVRGSYRRERSRESPAQHESPAEHIALLASSISGTARRLVILPRGRITETLATGARVRQVVPGVSQKQAARKRPRPAGCRAPALDQVPRGEAEGAWRPARSSPSGAPLLNRLRCHRESTRKRERDRARMDPR